MKTFYYEKIDLQFIINTSTKFIKIHKVSIFWQKAITFDFLITFGFEILNMCFKGSKSIILVITSTWQRLTWQISLENNAKKFYWLHNQAVDLGLNLSAWVIILYKCYFSQVEYALTE